MESCPTPWAPLGGPSAPHGSPRCGWLEAAVGNTFEGGCASVGLKPKLRASHKIRD